MTLQRIAMRKILKILSRTISQQVNQRFDTLLCAVALPVATDKELAASLG